MVLLLHIKEELRAPLFFPRVCVRSLGLFVPFAIADTLGTKALEESFNFQRRDRRAEEKRVGGLDQRENRSSQEVFSCVISAS